MDKILKEKGTYILCAAPSIPPEGTLQCFSFLPSLFDLFDVSSVFTFVSHYFALINFD